MPSPTSTHHDKGIEASPIEEKFRMALAWLDEGSAISRKILQEQDTYRHAVKRSAVIYQTIVQVGGRALEVQ